jgi:hypothetical protein
LMKSEARISAAKTCSQASESQLRRSNWLDKFGARASDQTPESGMLFVFPLG